MVTLQNTIDNNREVFLGDLKNEFYIYGTIKVESNKKIWGKGAKIIQLQDNTPIFDMVDKKNITIDSLILIGKGDDYQPSSSSLVVGINCWGANSILIMNSTFKNFSNAGILGLRNTSDIIISGNYFYGTGNNNPKYYQKDHTGVTIGGNKIFIKGNSFSNSSQGIIIAENSRNIYILNNTINNTTLEHSIYISTLQ
ncbi:right-handed parallel beta-helix repeat-containing protein [Chryseobacterium camelliae]|uniref:Right-handed parallel beta-helix repeat-containing protein n=1 Tax=Chryseobacterium camelliae TaxID=1265445 RepID=A0ABY7QPG9_9FLAO|nr:right-handed parallel beta-helix repeat-containing protein [Chryseobacterium camelliae]WBV61564.1 right-handed parallel beta-helix repeat-containing protein [Chryseobacterium camelliae]